MIQVEVEATVEVDMEAEVILEVKYVKTQITHSKKNTRMSSILAKTS
jgi:hypothetical protein